MNNDEVLARFGISKKLAYGMFFQSILVIIASLISIWGLFKIYNQPGQTLNYITNIISLLVCISLLVYSFYGFNAEKHQEAFFTSSIILYIILVIFGLITNAVNLKSPVSILTMVILISAIFFLHEHMQSFKSANYAMLVIVVASVIVLIFNILGGMPWFIALKYIIIPVTIGLTYFERNQRGKYDLI